jgi:hypothetical protein
MAKTKYFPFQSVFIIISAIIFSSIYVMRDNPNTSGLISNDIYLFFAFFASITYFAFQISMAGIKKGGENAIIFLLGGVAAKLLLTMIFALVYVYSHKVGKIQFLSNFFILYFIYSAFEIYSLLYNLRAQKIQ